MGTRYTQNNFYITDDEALDARQGPFASVAEALDFIEHRFQGLTVYIDNGVGSVAEYWFRDGIDDSDLILKAGAGGGDMYTSVYDVDNDGVVDSAETVKIIVRNSTGSTLLKGQIVYLSGATGNRPNAVLADATDEATSSKTIGMVAANIANNADGYVAVSGTLHDLDTSSFTAGNSLWLSETAGDYVANTPPADPAHAVFIGYVARSHPTQGRIVLAIQNGYELTELHGVTITSPATDHYLYYASDGLWKNRALTKNEVGLSNVDNTSDASKTFTASQITTGTFANARIPQVSRPVIRITTPASSGNSTLEQNITSISIPANTLSVGDMIRVGAMFSFASNTSTKTPRVRFGLGVTSGTNILYGPSTLAASIASNTLELIGIVTSTTNLRIGAGISTNSGLGIGTNATINYTIDTASTVSFSFNVQKTVGTDTAILEFAWVEILTA